VSERATPVTDSVVSFIVDDRRRIYPDDVIDAARFCLVDWTAVALGAADEPPGRILRTTMGAATGRSLVLTGGTADARTAALINGTLAHSLDFDDTHVASLTHISGPTWAATLALAPAAEGQRLPDAFVTGFEVGARLGGAFGPALLKRGIHATAVIGSLAATAAGCALLGLDRHQIRNALGLAATQAGGLTASFGTMAKPFHAGRAAMNAVMAVELARAGFTASPDVLDAPDGLAGALLQDRSISFAPIASDVWQILRNTFKPYASCLLTHPAIDCARRIHGALGNGHVNGVTAHVHPLAIQLAGKRNPRTALEGKFSLSFCIALGLTGRSASASDFSEARLHDPGIGSIAERVELQADPALPETAARMRADVAGHAHEATVRFALGNPENPMRWPDLEAKFVGLVEPRIGPSAKALFQDLHAADTTAAAAILAHHCARPKTSELSPSAH